MYRSRSELADFARGSLHHLHSSSILIVTGADKYQVRLSTIERHLPGLFKTIRRSLGHYPRDTKRQFDLVDLINSRFNPSKEVSYIIECAQTILDHVHQYDTGAVATALFRRLDAYIGHDGPHDARVHNWKALVKQFAVLGKLLDPHVLGCSLELFDDFSGWFKAHSYTIVRSMPIDAVLDFIRAFERTRRPFTDALESMIDSLDSRGEDELLYFDGKPTYLRSFISPRTMHKIRNIILGNIEGLRSRDGRYLPGLHDCNPDVLVRPGLLGRRHYSGSSRDLIPRAQHSELISGDDFCRGMLHDIVDLEPERILVQEPHVGPHLQRRRSRTRHRRGPPRMGGRFGNFGDDEFSYTDSEPDYDDYLPSPYEHDDRGVGGRVVPPCLMSPYEKADGFGVGFFDVYDDVGHAARPLPVMA